DVLRRAADAGLRPGHGHDAGRAVELRDIEADLRLAFGIELHGTGEEGDELLGRRVAGKRPFAAVAAGAQPPRGAERAVDQPAVEVADLHAEPALAEIPAGRIGRFVAGEVEDADIDGGDRDIGLLVRARAVDRKRDI